MAALEMDPSTIQKCNDTTYYTPQELAQRWKRSSWTIRNELKKTPGVLKFGSKGRTAIRIPASLVAEIESRLSI